MHPIVLRGARLHHLKGLDLTLRPGELTVITGVSGAGKSTLAFDTLYAEGQRRFVESFSPYARQYLERLQRPPLDELEPVAAAVAVDRRAPVKSSRSTLATMADVEAYLGALFTREARPVCPDCHIVAESRRNADRAAGSMIEAHDGAPAVVTYAVAIESAERYLEVREALARDGYRRLRVGDETRDLDELRPSEAVAQSPLRVVVDRLVVRAGSRRRLGSALEQAWERGDGRAAVLLGKGADAAQITAVRGLSCPRCGRGFAEPSAGLFSYQSPVGSCGTCRGFGRVLGIDLDKVIPDGGLSLAAGAIRPFGGKKTSWERGVLRAFCEREGIDMFAPWDELPDADRERVLAGEGRFGRSRYPGVRAWFAWLETKQYKMHVRVLLSRYRAYDPCPSCQGKRLCAESLLYRVGGLDLGEWHALELREARRRLEALDIDEGQGAIARDELATRLGYLERVGLGYLTLDRQARTLSGGEAQRVSLTAALGTTLTGTLFVLDEPTVGLHSSDLPPLIEAMRELSRQGNAVLVVEHDPEVIRAADRVVELGPGAGRAGGALVFDGTPDEARGRLDLATGRALAPPAKVPAEVARRAAERGTRARGRLDGAVRIRGARQHNLQELDVSIPCGAVVAVCGPSGSGKSTLVDRVLHRALARQLGHDRTERPGAHDTLEVQTTDEGPAIRDVCLVDQSPLGRTSRGNAATYTGAWSRVRALFAALPEADVRGLTPAHFSFNVAAGRCEACAGEGAETVEMQFLADVRLECPVCQGRRFREEVLAVRLDGLSVADVLDLSVDEALARFETDRAIVKALRPLSRLGLGYLPLGQPLSTLSGGEAQRVKLARALATPAEGTLFLLDEPSAGLHRDEVARVTEVASLLVDRGGSVVMVDHDLDVIGAADWVIELGPGAGAEGGRVVFEGTPRQLLRRTTRTGRALAAHRRPARGKRIRTPVAADDTSRAIEVVGAREHNLQNVDVRLPHGELVVITGPSGSGKSSLAFDVVFAEGQRRFLETLTPYARQFLPTMPRPDADRIAGLPPSIALEQRTSRAGAASTVATVTEVAHYLRLLFAKVGDRFCPDCDRPVAPMSADAIFARLRKGKHLRLRAPAVRARKGTYLEVFAAAERLGLTQAVVDGALVAVATPPRLDRRREHDIDLVVHDGPARALSRDQLDRALTLGEGQLVAESDGKPPALWSTTRACDNCGRALPELDPRWFSFNTRQGRCEACEGTGCEGGAEELHLADEEGRAPAPCPDCRGERLAPVPRAVRLAGERHAAYVGRSVSALRARLEGLSFEGDRALIAEAPLAELARRVALLDQVGLGYLSLDRRATTLSGGEMQRLRLAAQLGSGLTGALYVLDEPTIGLHPRDTHRLLANLRALVRTGSTVVVVEHDADTIRAADHLVDLGPGGGRRGGHVMATGTPAEVLASEASPTATALRAETHYPSLRRPPVIASPPAMVVQGARANNLRIDQVSLPSQRMCVVAGVSGSGKSTLVRHILFPAARRALDRTAPPPGAHGSVTLPATIGRAIAVDQSPIGRTPRSVPATFLKIWDGIRRLFAGAPLARERGYSASRFSFNSGAGGRCEACGGNGEIAHEMAFLPDVKTTCRACDGARFEPGTLEVRYLGLSIGEVLRLTVDEAVVVFAAHTRIVHPLQTLADLGVGYLQLGQGSPTLSGGEAQRLKLATELTAGRGHRPTLYVLDEPTTGLHHSDVGRLIGVLDRLVQRGDSLVIIEHHPAVIASADHVLELGPEGGEAGGRVIAEGTPSEVAACDTPTGHVLRRFFDTV